MLVFAIVLFVWSIVVTVLERKLLFMAPKDKYSHEFCHFGTIIPITDNSLTPAKTRASVFHMNQDCSQLLAEIRQVGGAPRTKKRKLFFLHGNGGHLEHFFPFLLLIDRLGYDLFALEYPGFAHHSDSKPSARDMIESAVAMWTQFADADSIVMGYSLGGGVLGQIYNKLDPEPAQIVFVNTFRDLPAVARFHLGSCLSSAVVPFMNVQWRTAPRRPTLASKILVIGAEGDTIVPFEETRKLAAQLQPCTQLTLTRGTHVTAPLDCVREWVPHLLPSSTHMV